MNLNDFNSKIRKNNSISKNIKERDKKINDKN